MSSRVLPDRAVIRTARSADRPFLEKLSVEVFSRYSANPIRGLQRMREFGTTLIAEHSLAGKPIPLGFVVIEVSTRRPAVAEFREPRLAHLSAIAVRPEASGCGIGRQLLEAAEEAAREQGAISMTLLTAKTNVVARALFESAGYSPILPIDDAYIDEQDAIHMLKSLTLSRD
jgi:ribosomal protein S18 acetylase RimI-like enzyme